MPSRDLECRAKKLGFHSRNARKTLKRDKMRLTLWKVCPAGEWRLEQRCGMGKAGG